VGDWANGAGAIGKRLCVEKQAGISDMLSFQRYLAAKKTIDDRSLNAHVWQALQANLTGAPRVLEVGAGIGTMIERVVERGLVRQGAYHAVDEQADNISALRARVAWLPAHDLTITAEVGDLLAFAADPAQRGAWDVLIAHAVLDLLDLPSALPRLLGVLRPGGLLYATINFDGVTALEPAVDPDFDVLIERLYHQTMDERITDGRRSGDSRAGRHLFELLRAQGAQILAAGASDWVVHAGPEGYRDDDAFFLTFILGFFEHSLGAHPALDPARLRQWLAARRAQIARGELVYIAHQLDLLARK
jgi:SAM-dependent methyltransferase